jgi:hypothetical protein
VEAFIGCHQLKGCGSGEEGDRCEPEPVPSFIEMHTAFTCTQCHSFRCKTSSSLMSRVF